MKKLIVFMLLVAFNSNAAQIGQKAPKLIGRQLSDNGIFFLSQKPKKPKVINFFWIECIPCKDELPEIASLEKRYPNVLFYAFHSGVNTKNSQNYTLQETKAFIKTLKNAPKNIIWGGANVMKEGWKINVYPSTVVLDANNKVKMKLYGYNHKNIRKLVKILDKF